MTITKEPPLTAEEARAYARMALTLARQVLDRLDEHFEGMTAEQQAAAAALALQASKAAAPVLYPKERNERYAAMRLIDDGPELDKEGNPRSFGLLGKGLLDMWNERDGNIRPASA